MKITAMIILCWLGEQQKKQSAGEEKNPSHFCVSFLYSVCFYEMLILPYQRSWLAALGTESPKLFHCFRTGLPVQCWAECRSSHGSGSLSPPKGNTSVPTIVKCKHEVCRFGLNGFSYKRVLSQSKWSSVHAP